MNICLILLVSALHFVLMVNSCKIQQKDVRLPVLLALLSLLLSIVWLDALEIHRLMGIKEYAIIDA